MDTQLYRSTRFHHLIPLVLIALLASGCASTYRHSINRELENKLNKEEGVLISIPNNGWYGNTEYAGSGRMTAYAIRSAFAKHTSVVDLTSDCHGIECLKSINAQKYGYYVKPEIFHWEDRATEWSGKPDRIEVQVIIYDTKTRKELANTSITGESKWGTFGGDHPQDLLAEPIKNYVNSLYSKKSYLKPMGLKENREH